MGVLTVADLTKRYGSTPAVSALSFEVPEGRILGLVGPNGAGKTTTLYCIAGLLQPDGGQILWNGQPLREVRGVVGLVPESPEVYPALTVYEHLSFLARLHGLPAGWEAEAQRWMERLDLLAHRDKVGAALSKGLRQRVILAGAALVRARLLLVDEPMIGLDPMGQREVRELVREMAREGASVLLSSHQLGLVEELADAVVIVDRGRRLAMGSIAELRDAAGLSPTDDLEAVFFRVLGREP
jgi:ABC-2 type transport system ATP-binding protein